MYPHAVIEMQNTKHYFVRHAMTFGAKWQASFDENKDEVISDSPVPGNSV